MNQKDRKASVGDLVQAALIGYKQSRTTRCRILITLFSLALLPAPLSVSSAQESARESRIDLLVKRLEHLARDHHVPGMGLAVATPDGVFTRAIGVADLESGRAVTPETIFEIGSITKTFTAVLIAGLAEEGKIDFDDSVRKHVPYFHLKDSDADEKVTLRDLLCHRTGVTRTDTMLNGGDDVTVEDVVRQLAMAEPLGKLRQQFLYNNQMFLVAGLAAEHAGGATFAKLLDERLFTPLKMDFSTAVLSEVVGDKRMSSGYRWLEAEQKYEPVPTRGIALCQPAGAILSSPTDMARYLSFLLARGRQNNGDPLLPREAFDDLWKVQIRTSIEGGYGLGFELSKWRGRTMVHHGGGIDAFTSILALLPEEGIGFALLTNAQFSSVPKRSIDIAFATLLGEKVQDVAGKDTENEAPFTAEELKAFTGDFYFIAANQVWIVFVDETGRLSLHYPGRATYKLRWPDKDGRWTVAPTVQVAFERDEAGSVAAMTLYNGPLEVRMPRTTHAGRPSVDDVFELIEGAMPHAAIKAGCPFRIAGSIELVHEGLSGRFELLYRDDKHWRFDKNFGKFGRITAVIDGDSGWNFTSMRGKEPMSAAEYARARRDAPFSTLSGNRSFYSSFLVLEVADKGDDERILLRAVPLQGPPMIIRIDAEGSVRSSDHAFTIGDLATIPVKTVYADIRDVQGFRLPHHVEVHNPLTGLTRVVTERIELNVTVPATAWEE